MYNDTVTLFNRYARRDGGVWYPTVLHGVDLNVDKAAILAKYGPESNDTARLHVKYRTENGSVYVGEKLWLPPKEWDRQTNDVMADSLTFSSDGVDFDFIWVGEWTDGIVNEADYGIDGFYNYMNSHHDFVFMISSVARYSVIPHFEILLR